MSNHTGNLFRQVPVPKFPNVQETRKMLAEEVVPPEIIRAVDPNVHPGDEERLGKQNAHVLALLRRGPLTSTDAISLGVTRLAARCWDLQRAGFRIKSTRVGMVAKYELEKA